MGTVSARGPSAQGHSPACPPPAGFAYQPAPTTSSAKRPPETQVEYDDPVLAIRKGRSEDLYVVDEFSVGWDGRGFRLTKDNGGPEHEGYDVFICRWGQNDLCDCLGFSQHSRCKHVDALRHLIESGQLDDPRAGAPVEPFPSPEQLAAQAGMNLPF